MVGDPAAAHRLVRPMAAAGASQRIEYASEACGRIKFDLI